MSLDESKFLGKGRSGTVFLEREPDGREVASKVFHGSFITDVAHYFLTGAPNPYIWNENAIWSAYHTRKIVADLVEYWFGQKLKVAEALEVRLNEGSKAYELRAEYIDGTHASLRHPFSDKRAQELSDLVNNIMNPLQSYLNEAGFDGLVWQAGKGNPTAIGNFLRQHERVDGKWVWIDLESGVPAVIPLDGVRQIPFFLSKLKKYRRAMFDDVDTEKLRKYVESHKDGIIEKLGNKRYGYILDNMKELEHHQTQWKSVKWAHRSVKYRLMKEEISQEHADFYFEHPLLWIPPETLRRISQASNKFLGDIPWEFYNYVILTGMSLWQRKAWKFLYSNRYRVERTKEYYEKRIDEMENRRMLTSFDANQLRAKLETEQTAEYLADFGFHTAMKIPDKFLQIFVYPPLYIAGAIDGWMLAKCETFTGSVLRTGYSMYKLLENLVAGNESEETNNKKVYVSGGRLADKAKQMGRRIIDTKHLVASLVGLAPVVGTIAYPVESVVRPSVRDSSVAQFILDDSFARLAEFVPLIGGRDTRIEHYLNRLPGRILGYARQHEVL